MDSGIIEFFAKNVVLDVVEVVGRAFDGDETNVPRSVDLVNASTEVFDAGYGEVANDELERKRVVGVNPVRFAFVFTPCGVWVMLLKFCKVLVQGA